MAFAPPPGARRTRTHPALLPNTTTPPLQEEIQYELDRRRPGQSKITTPRKETDTCELLSGMAPDGATTLGTPICVLVRNGDQKSGDYSEMEQAYRPSHAGTMHCTAVLCMLGCAGWGLEAVCVCGGGAAAVRRLLLRLDAAASRRLLRRARPVCSQVQMQHLPTLTQLPFASTTPTPFPSDATYDFKYGIRAVAGGGRSSARETIGRVAAGAVAKKLLHQVRRSGAAGAAVGEGA